MIRRGFLKSLLALPLVPFVSKGAPAKVVTANWKVVTANWGAITGIAEGASRGRVALATETTFGTARAPAPIRIIRVPNSMRSANTDFASPGAGFDQVKELVERRARAAMVDTHADLWAKVPPGTPGLPWAPHIPSSEQIGSWFCECAGWRSVRAPSFWSKP